MAAAIRSARTRFVECDATPRSLAGPGQGLCRKAGLAPGIRAWQG